jgi:DNA sulfur modification protein DndE
MRTTKFIEESIQKIAKLIHATNDPKWLTIRFAIFVSLSINKTIEKKKLNFKDGKTYSLEVITGKGKSEGDYTDIIALMVVNNDNIELKNEKELEKYLELHAQRGFEILTYSLNQNSDIFIWIKEEFL